MVTIRSVNEIILSLIDFFRLAQPDLDIKPGTVARDLFIDAPAGQLALLYDELSGISNKQSLRLVVGNELDQLAKNFGIIRRKSTFSSGVALFTFSSLNSPVSIRKGDVVTASNGFGFSVSNSLSVQPSSSNYYRSVATQYRSQLDLLGISDEFAAEVTVVATSAGSLGNIGTYTINKTSIPGVSNVTNITAFTGGADQENDTIFRNRVLSAFGGSSVGTALGYLNTALSTSGVIDAVVIEPGDPLMTRDGAEVKVNTDGSRTIISEGSGGKVDVVVLGSTLIENTDSIIYIDKSNSNDPSSAKNNIVLGQISGDENKTINRKRLDNIASGILPTQPVENILQVTGSISGSNFVEKTVDEYGRVSGNFELIKDTGAYSGGPWGFDTFHWISDHISLFQEDRVKSQFNGQDNVSYTDVLNISKAQQFVSINNENSTVTYDRSVIQLLHTPCTNVTRVFNVNTGERYVVTNQNLDETGTYNTTGRIKISGNTLPSPSDILQVDYVWVITYDQYSDFDGLVGTSNPRPVTDSVDWGYASVIKNEEIWFEKNTVNDYFVGTASHPISSIISAKTFSKIDTYVETVTSGLFINRLAVVVRNTENPADAIDSITIKNSNIELFNTPQNNGTVINETTVFGVTLLYNITIILPTDCPAVAGDKVTVYMNSSDVFYSNTNNSSFTGSQITIPASLIDTLANSILLEVTYIASVSDLFSSATTLLPTSRAGNGFSLSNNTGFNNFSITNISRRENATVQQNLSSEYYLDLSISSTDFSLIDSQIISVIRLSDGVELWNSDNPGSVIIGSPGNYQLILSGYNTPAINDKCLIVYYATDSRRFQPFSFSNTIIKTRIDSLAIEPLTGRFYIPINSFYTQPAGLTYTIVEPNSDIILYSITDGYLTAGSGGTATVGSLLTNFASQPDLTAKKLKIFGATNPNNNGTFDILSYDLASNTMIISNVLDHLTTDQVSIIRVLDGKEIWNYSGTIQQNNNRLLLQSGINAKLNDKVFVLFYNFKNLRTAQTRLSCTTVDQVVNSGVITVNGTTINKASDVIFTATSSGLTLNLAEAMRKALNLSSTASIPSTVRLAKLLKLEKVTTVSANSEEVLTVNATYDVTNTTIQNNLLFASEMLSDTSLQSTEFTLPSTQNNTLNVNVTNLPAIGDKLRVTFYYTTDNDLENLSYTRNGILYTNKKFALINRVYISSGFRSSLSTRFTITSFTQPALGSRYKIFYDYLSPKQNERISIRYNYNRLIADTTFSIEDTRPINADVLVRAAKIVYLDLIMNVVIADDYKSSETTVLQNLRNQLNVALTSTSLGTVVDQPTLINVAQAVAGIARARILHFNKEGNVGQLLTIQAQKDEFFLPNTITINTETR